MRQKRTPTLDYEREHWRAGKQWIVGVDEVGRGAWAGPIVAAAVVFEPDTVPMRGLRDSKQLSPERRGEFFAQIITTARAWGVVAVSSEVIDTIGIAEANRRAMRQAIGSLGLEPDHALIDGFPCAMHVPNTAMIEGDENVYSIAAASVIAKVWRDHLLIGLHKRFVQYRFHEHKGYGTRRHEEAIRKYGMCAIHRRSFVPARCLEQTVVYSYK